MNGSPEPDRLLHLVLTWADAGQLAKLGDSICRNGDQLPLAAQLAAATLNARGMIGQRTNSNGAISRTLMMAELGYDLLAEWDALVAGKPEPVQPPGGTPSCLDDDEIDEVCTKGDRQRCMCPVHGIMHDPYV